MLVHLSSTSPIPYITDQIDASVAPPRLTTSAPLHLLLTRSAIFTGTQSPLSSTSLIPPSSSTSSSPSFLPSSYSNSIPINAGTLFHTVTPSPRIAFDPTRGSFSSPAPATTSFPPPPSTPKMSYTDRSKLNDDSPYTTSSLPTPNRSLISSIVFTAPRWSIITPFGFPVDPEVYITYARSSSPCSSPALSSTFSSSHSATSPPTVSTSTPAGHSNSSPSSTCLTTTFPPRHPCVPTPSPSPFFSR